MVTYDYQCTDCGKIYEILHKKTPTKKELAAQKSECCESPLERQLSAPNINTGSSGSSGYKNEMLTMDDGSVIVVGDKVGEARCKLKSGEIEIPTTADVYEADHYTQEKLN